MSGALAFVAAYSLTVSLLSVTVRFLSTEQLVEFTLTPVGCAFVLSNELQQLCVLSLYVFLFGTKVRTDGLDFAVEVGLKVPYRFPTRAAQGSTVTGARCGFHCTRMQVAVDRRAICGTRRADVVDDLGSSGIVYQLVVSSGCLCFGRSCRQRAREREGSTHTVVWVTDVLTLLTVVSTSVVAVSTSVVGVSTSAVVFSTPVMAFLTSVLVVPTSVVVVSTSVIVVSTPVVVVSTPVAVVSALVGVVSTSDMVSSM